MRSFRLFLITIFLSTVGAASAGAEDNVLMVVWYRHLASEKAFEKELKRLRPDVKIHYLYAERSKNRLSRLLRNYDWSKIDLVYTTATNNTVLVKNFLKDRIPHVFTNVSTPVLTGVIKSFAKTGGNRTGASLLMAFDDQIELFIRLKNIKNMVIWFDPREKQNNDVTEALAKAGARRGLKVSTFRVIPDSKRFGKSILEASHHANTQDMLYVIAGASFLNSQHKMYDHLDPGLLIMSGAGIMTRYGATVAISASLAERGRTVANMAHKILNGTQAGDIPASPVTLKNARLYVNKDKMEEAGLSDIRKVTLGLEIIYTETEKRKK